MKEGIKGGHVDIRRKRISGGECSQRKCIKVGTHPVYSKGRKEAAVASNDFHFEMGNHWVPCELCFKSLTLATSLRIDCWEED